MIKKLQRKFIIIAMATISIVAVAIVGTINVVNYVQTNSKIDFLLNFISDNDGVFPEYNKNNNNRDFINQESEHSARYFSIKINSDGEAIDSNLEHIITIKEQQINDIIEDILETEKDTGYYENYKYLITEKDGYKLIVFLDCMTYIQDMRYIQKNSLIISITSLLIVYILLKFFSKTAINPMIENVSKQRQFVTDAGHELKTPVAIILANTEILEIKNGEDEWTKSIKKQANRLDYLIKKLLRLSRLEEKDMKPEFHNINFSELVKEAVNSIEVINQNGIIEKDIQDDIELYCDRESIYELVSILMDNAIKYVSKDGKIGIYLKKQDKIIKFEVSNNCDNISGKECEKLFERFYRRDASRNSKTGGYGIGLSMAKAIADMHKGKIYAKYNEGAIHFIVEFNITK